MERRKTARVAWSGKVRITEPVANRILSSDSRVRNVGPRGFSFVTEDNVRKGQKLRFDMDLTTTKVSVVGTVVHHRPEATYAICGVRFTEMGLIQRGRINRFLAARSSSLQSSFLLKAIVTGLLAGAIAHVLFHVSGPMIGVTALAAFGLGMMFLPF